MLTNSSPRNGFINYSVASSKVSAYTLLIVQCKLVLCQIICFNVLTILEANFKCLGDKYFKQQGMHQYHFLTEQVEF